MDVERHVTVLHGGAGRRGGKRLRYRSFPRVARQGFVVPVGDCNHRPPVGGRRGQPVQLHRDGDAREHLEPGAVRGPPPRYRPGQTAFSGPFPRPRIHRPTSRDGAGGHRPGHRQQPAEHRVLRRGPPLAANRPPGPGPAPERLLPPGSGGEPPRGAARAPSLAVLRVWHMLFVQSSTDKPPLSCADAAVTADNRALSELGWQHLSQPLVDVSSRPGDQIRRVGAPLETAEAPGHRHLDKRTGGRDVAIPRKWDQPPAPTTGRQCWQDAH